MPTKTPATMLIATTNPTMLTNPSADNACAWDSLPSFDMAEKAFLVEVRVMWRRRTIVRYSDHE